MSRLSPCPDHLAAGARPPRVWLVRANRRAPQAVVDYVCVADASVGESFPSGSIDHVLVRPAPETSSGARRPRRAARALLGRVGAWARGRVSACDQSESSTFAHAGAHLTGPPLDSTFEMDPSTFEREA
jgi:hypothetical protein